MLKNSKILSLDRFIRVLCLILTLISVDLFSQITVNGPIINEYASVSQHWINSGGRDSVVVDAPEKFAVDDIVMLYVVKGFDIDTNPDQGDPTGGFGNVGQYALMVIESKNGNTIVFNNTSGFESPAPQTDPVLQLIKVAVYDSAIIKDPISAPAWDSTSGTGGVVAIYARGRLKLEADIDVSGKGFAGATPFTTDTYSGACYFDDLKFQEGYLALSDMDFSGLKGEGAGRSNTDLRRGFGAIINGGGGGNGKFSGGGGGSNFEQGGNGYGQSDECPTPNIGGGKGGVSLRSKDLYQNPDESPFFKNRLFFGGGGGTGVYNTGGAKSSPGGNGGGIVVIIADRLDWDNGVSISANGSSVTSIATGGGGGGGAGGCIVLDVSTFQGDGKINLSAIGGNGGSTLEGGAITGPGGGGGGGLYWLSYYDENIIDTLNTRGQGGETNAGGIAANQGGAVGLKTGLQAPLAGFLFNSLPVYDSVCTDIDPAPPIDASRPKGGVVVAPDYDYTYLWLESSSNDPTSFAPAAGVNNQRTYSFTAPLTSKMYYRRIIEDDNSLVDTSAIFEYRVLPKINGNVIAVPDSLVCYGESTLDLIPAGVLSGAYISTSTPVFLWEKKAPGGTWMSADEVNDQNSYALPELYDTTYFRRVVSSGVCKSYSNPVRMNVLDPITKNTISSKDTLCQGQSPEMITGKNPEGGDLVNYWYDWEKSYDITGGSFNAINQENKDLDYTDSTLYSNRWFRRIVYSGLDSSCVYVSDTLKIEVLKSITGNLITTPDLLLCQDSLYAPGVRGTSITNGGDGNYTYKWQTSTDNVAWITRQNNSSNQPLAIPSYSDDTYVRRVVISGKDSVCTNTSGVMTISVLPKLLGNNIKDTSVIICENEALSLPLNGPVVTQGAGPGTYSYQWISSKDGSPGSWSDLSGTDAQNYVISSLDSTRYFRRVVWSDKTLATCVDTTREVFIYEVPDSIENNIIYGGADYKEICFGDEITIDGTVPEKGYTPGDYKYRWYYGNNADNLNDSLPGDDFQNSPALSPQETTVYRRMVYDDHCKSLSDTIRIYVRDLPSATLSLSSSQDNVICESPVQLEVEIENNENHASHSVILSYSFDEASGTLEFQDEINDIFTVSHDPQTTDSATYYYELVEVVDDSGCVADVLLGNPSVKVFQKPEPAIISDSISTCGEITLIAGSGRNGATGAQWVQISPQTPLVTFDNDTMRSTYMRLINPEGYDLAEITLGWKLSTPRCDSTATRVFTFYENPENTELLADTVEFYVEETYDLTQFEPELDAGQGEWSVDNSGTSLLEDSTTATDFIFETRHKFTYTVSNGICEPKTDDITLIQHDLRQFNAFSPNNDPFNQEFVIPGLIHASEFTFVLYNSWGTKIMTLTKEEAVIREIEIDGEMKNEYLVWDGTLGQNGEAAQPGTYYYTLSYKIEGSKSESKSGYIMLRR